MKRSKSYDEELSKKLRNSKFARTFIRALMEGDEGLSVEAALRHTIERMGIKEGPFPSLDLSAINQVADKSA